MNLVVVTNILTPYRIPLFDAIRQRVGRFNVLLMAEREENRDWTLPSVLFEHEVLDGMHFRLPNAPVSLHVNTGVMRRLRQLNPDVVLGGGYAPANAAACIYCKLQRRKYVSWGELRMRDIDDVSLLRRGIRWAITAGSAGAVASSSEAKDVFVRLGAAPEKVLTAVMPIDVEFFNARARAFRTSPEFAPQRAAYTGAVLLAIGQLIDRKGYRELFDIYADVLAKRPDTALLILGDGPQRADYEALVRSRGWSRVAFLGFRQADEVVRYLALADVFVFPTLDDPFGAAVAEAMAAEVPVVSSRFAAATRDLVDQGVTGYCIDPRDTQASAETILTILAMAPGERRALGRRGYERVRCHDIETTAAQMVRFLHTLSAATQAEGIA
jgi:glycosyltransferase involved in cell wall biosynthesis